MSKTRYKIRKEQLERVVENFVMESAKKNVKTISESDQRIVTKISKKYNISESEVIRKMEMIREFDEGAFNKKLKQLAYGAVSKGYMSSEEATSYENKIKAEASKDNFEGNIKMDKDESGKWVLYYVPSGEVTGKTAKLPWWKRVTSGEWRGR